MVLNVKFKDLFRRHAVLAVALVCSAFVSEDTLAAPVMHIVKSEQYGELDFTTPVSNTVSELERKYNYSVSNFSPENVSDNYLIELVIPAGTNQGVYYATEESASWDVQILADSTVFSGNGEFIAVLSNLTFSIYVPGIQPAGTAFIEANAAGNGGMLAFDSVEVASPTAFPATTIPLTISGTSFGFDADPGNTYTVYFTPSLTDASWTTLMIISGNGASVTIPFDPYHDTGFYKVEEH